MLARLILPIALALPLAACGLIGLDARQDADLRGVVDRIRAGDLAGVESAYDPRFRTPALHQTLGALRAQIPQGAPAIRLLKGVSEKDAQGRIDYGGIYEYVFPAASMLAQVEMRQDQGGRRAVVLVNLRPEPPGLVQSFAFGLTGKKYYQYIFLVLMALPPVLGAWALAALWRAPDIRWKWIWALAMTVGFMDLTMDWRTGDVFLNIIDIHFLWLRVARFGPLSPWMLSTSLPLAPIAFLLGYRPPRQERPWDGPRKT
jgi:hypothetical protein